jgi:probable HAF family extracellular repeat protein
MLRHRAVIWISICVFHACYVRGELIFTGIGDLPGGHVSSGAYGLSADGSTVVGFSRSSLDNEAIRWTHAGGMQGLGFLPHSGISTPASRALGVSGDGSVISGWSDSTVNSVLAIRAFRWTESTGMTYLPSVPPAETGGIAHDVSNSGTAIAGFHGTPSGDEAYRWTSSGLVGLGDLPGSDFHSRGLGMSGDGDTVVGYSRSSNGSEAFGWTASSGISGLGDLPGGQFWSQAEDASSDGSVIVGFGSTSSGTEAFRWTSATGMQSLGDLPGGRVASGANAVSADGSVIVGSGNVATTNGTRAFIWDTANGLRNLQDVLNEAGLDTTGWELTTAQAISDDGLTFAGTGRNPDGRSEGWYARLDSLDTAAVPEPGSFLLAGLAFVAALTFRRWSAR